MDFDAIVLAGGAAARLGGVDKPQLTVGGRTLLDRVVAAVADARRVVVVGPEQPVGRRVVFCREEPPGGGPVAALAAGVPHTSADVVVVLAADLPWIAPAVPRLCAALGPAGAAGFADAVVRAGAAVPAGGAGFADVAVLVDATGRPNYLAAAWRRTALVNALARLGAPGGAAMRSLVGAVTQAGVPDEGAWGRDCDTWDDLAQARALLEGT
jgi:molybdopterin-guanine dinucleotide biosynthesis protein A